MEIEGNITRKKIDGQRRAFMLDNGEWVSTFFNDKTKPEFKEAIDGLDEGHRALFTVTKNQKGFLNINAVEPIIQTDEPSNDKPSPITSPALTNRDKIEILRIAANNATANTKTEKELGDPEQWATWFSTLRKALEEEYWKM